ncbi:hypothetical protein NL676_021088 [Syzygium grande]|nr:hypothetical protein NL676_021088 [Syzygium grande]
MSSGSETPIDAAVESGEIGLAMNRSGVTGSDVMRSQARPLYLPSKLVERVFVGRSTYTLLKKNVFKNLHGQRLSHHLTQPPPSRDDLTYDECRLLPIGLCRDIMRILNPFLMNLIDARVPSLGEVHRRVLRTASREEVKAAPLEVGEQAAALYTNKGGGRGSGGRDRGGGHGGTAGRGRETRTCNYCGIVGHLRSYCRKLQAAQAASGS